MVDMGTVPGMNKDKGMRMTMYGTGMGMGMGMGTGIGTGMSSCFRTIFTCG